MPILGRIVDLGKETSPGSKETELHAEGEHLQNVRASAKTGLCNVTSLQHIASQCYLEVHAWWYACLCSTCGVC